jgi:hypothetical protein
MNLVVWILRLIIWRSATGFRCYLAMFLSGTGKDSASKLEFNPALMQFAQEEKVLLFLRNAKAETYSRGCAYSS